jgi:ribosomal protein L20
MSALQELDFNYQTFLDKTTILYGESKTGKSTVIIDILYQLFPFVDQIIVISPTDRQNHTYSGKSIKERVVPLPCIHYAISDKLLKDIWERQEALVAVYTKANDAGVIKSLFEKLNLTDVKKIMTDISERRQNRENEIRSQYTDGDTINSKIEEMDNDFRKLTNMVHKHYINENRGRLSRVALTEDEKFTLRFLNLNPRLVLIFDDCTDQLAKFKNHPVMQKIAFQARWNFITTLLACHTDKSLDPAFKKNAFNSVFTEQTCANAYFGRGSNDFDKDDKERAKSACRGAFTPVSKHQKLIWVREDKKFYRFTATKRDGFRFGCDALWNLSKQIESEGMNFSEDNKFISGFMQ